MKAALKYTLARLGLLVVVFVLLLPVPNLSIWVKALAALLVTMPMSWFLLKGMRDDASVAFADWVQRRRERRAKLRAALAGDDDPPSKPSAS